MKIDIAAVGEGEQGYTSCCSTGAFDLYSEIELSAFRIQIGKGFIAVVHPFLST
jgi:hypothetical protein